MGSQGILPESGVGRPLRTVQGSHPRAFTIVELLVVVGIIVTLAGLLLPALSRARAHAQFAACKNQLRSQVQAVLMYAANYQGYKPPLFQRRPLSVRVDWVSPDVRWTSQPVGLGLLADGKYLTLDSLLDVSSEMQEDAQRDRQNWSTLPTSGCSYGYYWRHPEDVPSDLRRAAVGATVQFEISRKRTAVVMDLNAEAGHAYFGEYQGRPWVNHPKVKRLNVAYLDGSVRDYPVEEVQMRFPGGQFEELQWFEQAHAKAR